MPLEPLTTRSGKGSALTHPEVDANWETIEDFLNALEDRIDVSLNSDGTLVTDKVPYATTAIGSDAYAVTISGTVSAVADLAGRVILVRIDVANTGAATLNVNSLGATSIKKHGAIDLASGDLKPGIAALTYDATNSVFNLLNPGTNSKENYSTCTNSSNDYTVTISSLNTSSFEVPAAYYAGYAVKVKMSAANTGAARLKIASTTPSIDLGFADIKKNAGTALSGGELQADQIYEFVHDGTNFQIASNGASSVVLQIVETSLASASSNAATIPDLSTIPQNTEGTEILTLSITPKSASSKLYVEVLTYLGNSGANNKVVAALFRDSTADAIAAAYCNVDGTNTVYSLPVKAVENSTAATATTFKLRVSSDSGTTYWNRPGGAANNLGGVMKTTLQITEVLT